MRVTGAIFFLGGVGLSGLPPSGTWAGKTLIEEEGGHWVLALGIIASALTAGAVLRVWLRVFHGAGQRLPGTRDHHDRETEVKLSRLPWTMLAPGLLLVVAGLLPGAVLGHAVAPLLPGAEPAPWTVKSVLSALPAVALAFGVAVPGVRGYVPRATVLHRLHSGHVGDYVAWMLAGVTLFGVLLLA